MRAYLGLVLQEDSSGERRQRGRMTKAGDLRVRSLLVEVAWLILSSKKAELKGLKQWAERSLNDAGGGRRSWR